MLLPKFEYHEPTTLEEACQIMSELGHGAKPLAGGTDLIVNMKKKIVSPGHLVSLSMIDDLKKIDASNGLLKIGACLTAAELAESKEIRETLTALSRGAESLGSPLIRNLATIGGNLISARPAADLPPALIAYGAKVALKNSSGERLVSLEDLFLGPGETLIGPNEILTEIHVDSPPPSAGAAYIKLGVREALEISLVNVAAFISMDRDGSIQEARIVLGSVAPTPIRATSAEQILTGEKPSETLFSRAGEAASNDSKPIDDFRASAEYKRAMVEVLTQRALNQALIKVRDEESN
jgi:carbon-monoxide dehydrogenase medium subunit